MPEEFVPPTLSSHPLGIPKPFAEGLLGLLADLLNTKFTAAPSSPSTPSITSAATPCTPPVAEEGRNPEK